MDAPPPVRSSSALEPNRSALTGGGASLAAHPLISIHLSQKHSPSKATDWDQSTAQGLGTSAIERSIIQTEQSSPFYVLFFPTELRVCIHTTRLAAVLVPSCISRAYTEAIPTTATWAYCL